MILTLTFTAGLTFADPLALVEEEVADELPLPLVVAEEFVWLPDETVAEEVAADEDAEVLDESAEVLDESAEVLDEASVVLVDPDDPFDDPVPSEPPPVLPLVLPPVSPLVALPPVLLPPTTPPELA